MATVLRTLIVLVLVAVLSPHASAQCSLSFVGAVTATYSSPPRQVVFAGTVANAGTGVKQVVLRVRYSHPSGIAGAFTFGPVPLGPSGGTPFSITQSIPNTAPLGVYTLGFELIDFTAGPPGVTCAFQPGSVTVVPPRMGRPVGSDEGWEATPAPSLFGAPLAGATTGAAVSPNPFAGRTELRYTLTAAADVRLGVYDALGREVARLVDGYTEAGTHRAVFDARGLAAGVYVWRLAAGEQVQTGRLTLAR